MKERNYRLYVDDVDTGLTVRAESAALAVDSYCELRSIPTTESGRACPGYAPVTAELETERSAA